MELFVRLAAHAAETPGAVAAREVGVGADAGASLTYGELVARVGGVAQLLSHRLSPGDVVVLMTGNRVEYFAACLGVWAAGRTVLPMHPSAGRELTATAGRARAALVIVDSRYTRESTAVLKEAGGRRYDVLELREVLRSAAEAERLPEPRSGAGLMLQSSGTTGLPKIVRRPGNAIDAVARNVAESAGLTRGDRVFAAVPICHAYGIENGFLAPLWAGAAVHLCDGLDVPVAMREFAGEVGHGGSTVFPGVPFMFEVLAKAADERGSCEGTLRLAYSAGGMLPRAVAEGFERRVGRRVGQLYGASELGSVTFNHPDHPAADAISVGRPMPGVSVRVLDPDDPEERRTLPHGGEGIVAIRAPSMMSGYVDGDAPIVDGHFLTGDLGRVDGTGALTIIGRLKQLIDVGGMKVNPAEVEGVLSAHPSVRECAVVGVAVTPTVSRLKAVVVPVNGELDVEGLRRFARERLAGYKVPRLVEVRAGLPRTPSGKVLRAELEAEG
jgi:acyl-CoA synthetase (AMP-forming)/AMP-acid ligase II